MELVSLREKYKCYGMLTAVRLNGKSLLIWVFPKHYRSLQMHLEACVVGSAWCCISESFPWWSVLF